MNHLTKGLEVLMTMPDTLERARQELDLQTTLGPAFVAVEGFGSLDAERAYARARELCQQVGESSQLFPALYGLCMFYTVRAEFQASRELAEQLFSLAQRVQDPALLLAAHRVMGTTMFWLGHMASARAHLEQGIALYDPQKHRSHTFLYGHDPGVGCRCFAAMAIWMLGYPDQSLQSIHEAQTFAQELTHPFSLGIALAWAAVVHQFRREAQAVQEHAEALKTLSTEQGFPHWLAIGRILRGWALQGEGAEGIAQMRQGLGAYRTKVTESPRSYFLALLAEAYGEVGQPEEGLAVLVEALDTVNKTEERNWEAELYRCKGEFLLVQQDKRKKVGEAEECFRQALDVAHRQQAKSLELRATMSLSRLWQQQGRQEEAHQLLAEIYSWFTEGFDTADLKEAKALLEELA
jgi:predicted ATPase